MTWFKCDDQLADHPKVMALGDARLPAVGLWTICGTYCAKHLTDGFVPDSVARMYGGPKATRIIGALTRVGLFEPVPGGYRMHDYHDYNPTREKVSNERAKKRAAGQAGGQASAQARAQASADPAGSEPAEPRPVPSPSPVPVDVSMYIEPADLYFEKVGRKPGIKEKNWLEDLHVRFSRTELVRGMQAVPKGRDYLKRLDAFMEGRAA
jgi:hypothetical protein